MNSMRNVDADSLVTLKAPSALVAPTSAANGSGNNNSNNSNNTAGDGDF
jgi:hypothetical protein